MSDTKHKKVNYSLRGAVRPSAVFSIRIPDDLECDLMKLCSHYQINRNELIKTALSYLVNYHHLVVASVFGGVK